MGCAIPPRKTHSISFQPRQLCYRWHPWYGRIVLTRSAGGAHAETAYFCRLPDAAPDVMLVEIPRWMFDAAQCAAMQLADIPHVECLALRALKITIVEQNASLKAAKIERQLSLRANQGGMDDTDSEKASNDPIGTVRRIPSRSALGRSRRAGTSRSKETSGTATGSRAGQKSATRPLQKGSAR
jgi:hypothetical protein